MGEVIGELLPVALGVAVSPIPIVAVILMLLAPHARAASLSFLVGWVLGVGAVVTLVVLLVDPTHDDGEAPATWVSVLKILLGCGSLVLALRQWQSRPRPGEEPALPAWMAAVDTMTPPRAIGLGVLLSAINPKNLGLCVTGGLTIGSGGLSTGDTAVVIAVFVLIGSCSVGVPVLGFLVAQDRLRGPLEDLREWLTANNATVMSVVLLVIGTTVLGKGIGGL